MYHYKYILILFMLFIIFSCQDTVKLQEDLTPVAVPEYNEALVVFISGEVDKLENGKWSSVDIGDFIIKQDKLKVGLESFCELQFGNAAIIRVQENTEVSIETLCYETDAVDISLKMDTGLLLCKVEKLATGEKFRVKTRSSICGVRGTEFMVNDQEDTGTVLAVADGEVAVLPAAADMEELKAEIMDKSETITDILDKIEENAIVVQSDQELVVDEQTFEQTEKEIEELKTVIKNVIKREPILDKIEIKQEELKVLETKVNEIIKKHKSIPLLPKLISEENKKKLETIKQMKILEIRKLIKRDRDATGEGVDVEEEIRLVKISLITEPKDARIILNTQPVGRGRFSGLFIDGEELHFLVSRVGFEDQKIDLKVQKGADSVQRVILEKIEPVKKPVTEQDKAVENVQRKEKITLKVNPPDADILLNNKPVGKGTFTGEFRVGEKVNVAVRKQGLEPKAFEIIIKPGMKSEYEISLIDETSIDDKQRDLPSLRKPRIYPVSEVPIVQKIANFGDIVITADKEGTLAAVNMDGRILWKILTENRPNQKSFPIIMDDKVYFSGSREFIIAYVETGEILARVTLEGETSHVFGQYVTRFHDVGIFPARNAIFLFDLNNGNFLRQIVIPGGLLSIPAVFNDKILTVNQDGILFIINPERGNIEHEIPSRAIQPLSLPVVVIENKALWVGRKGIVACAELDRGILIWDKELLPDKRSILIHDIERGEREIFIHADDMLFALSIDSTDFLFRPLDRVTASPKHEGAILLAGMDGRFLNVIEIRTGRIQRRFDTHEMISTKPLVAFEKILLGTERGQVMIIDPQVFEQPQR